MQRKQPQRQVNRIKTSDWLGSDLIVVTQSLQFQENKSRNEIQCQYCKPFNIKKSMNSLLVSKASLYQTNVLAILTYIYYIKKVLLNMRYWCIKFFLPSVLNTLNNQLVIHDTSNVNYVRYSINHIKVKLINIIAFTTHCLLVELSFFMFFLIQYCSVQQNINEILY